MPERLSEEIGEQLDRIRRAYDLTVKQHNKGIDPFSGLPEEIKESPGFRYLAARRSQLNSGTPDIREYLEPRLGMRFLDAGCCANLANYRLDQWPSTYYGVDMSSPLINAMRRFVAREHILVGGLSVADLSKLPFEDNFFGIAAVIGVLEYCPIEYAKSLLQELNRVLTNHAKTVLDMPNQVHPYYNIMLKLEEHLGRPVVCCSRSVFEKILRKSFLIERVADSEVMLKYFVQAIK